MRLVLPHWEHFALFIPANRITYFRVCPKRQFSLILQVVIDAADRLPNFEVAPL
jgi:hypothetical protein